MWFWTGRFFLTTSALVLAGASAQAQDAATWQLPPSQKPSSAAQGPVVPDAPPPRPTTTTPPTTEPAPPVVVVPSPSESPPARTFAPPARATAGQSPRDAGAPAAPIPINVPQPSPSVSPSAAVPLDDPARSTADPSPAPRAAATPPAANAEGGSTGLSGFPWPWVAAAGLLLAGIAGWIARRRQLAETDAQPVAFEAPIAPKAPPPAAAALDRTRDPAAPPLLVDLTAARMSASLINATLSYRLLLTAGSEITDLVVRGGMTSAHASRPAEQQLSAAQAPQLHSLDRLARGEIVELVGEFRLPIAEITPIRHGSAALLVPLVRVEVTGLIRGNALLQRAAFVVGIEENSAGERLQPFRLDLGPRIYSRVSQRALTIPAFA